MLATKGLKRHISNRLVKIFPLRDDMATIFDNKQNNRSQNAGLLQTLTLSTNQSVDGGA